MDGLRRKGEPAAHCAKASLDHGCSLPPIPCQGGESVSIMEMESQWVRA